MHDINIWPLLLLLVIAAVVPAVITYKLLGKLTDYVVFKLMIALTVVILSVYFGILFVVKALLRS